MTPSTIKILHLEDLPTDAELIAFELRRSGLSFERRLVDNREDYMRCLKDFVPDIVLSDHSLPSFDSLEALSILKEMAGDIPFILITATVSEEFAVKIMKEGASDYILKDRLQRLPRAIENTLEKYRIEAERKKVSRELNLLFTTIDEVFFSIDAATGEILQLSPACEQVYGYTLEEFRAKPGLITDIVHPADRPAFLRNLGQQTPAAIRVLQYQAFHKDGRARWLETKFVFVRDELPVLSRVNGVTRDITDRKLAEARLVHSEANLRSIFENTDHAIFLMDNDLRLLSFNSYAAMLIERNRGQTLETGREILDYFPPEGIRDIHRLTERVKKGESVSYERYYEQQPGITDWYDVTWTGVHNANKEHVGLILTLKDITRRKQEERDRDKLTADLVQRNKDLEQFAYIVSHNLRAPVANILGLSNVLDIVTPNEPEFWEVAGAINTTVKQLDQVIIDLNQVLQINHHVNDRMEMVDLSALMAEIRVALSQMIHNNQATLNEDFGQVGQLMTLKSYLYSIFQNLIVNSIKYCRPGVLPVITVRSSAENGMIRLLFQDNGKGIDLDRYGNQLFGLYKRFDTSVEGKGMGLFMVRAQVEGLGGRITVQSELGRGSSFLVEIPEEGRG